MLYFDVFKYPLTVEELYENSAICITREQFREELDLLLSKNLLRKEGDFILNTGRTKNDIEKRVLGNEGARKIMPVAYRYAKKIASYPFVEAVFLSGSLSKNYFDSKADIDYFIVTKPGRLWICRTLLIVRYKLLPASLKKYWCTNYFVSTDHLEIPDVNAFTGTELAFLIPTVNYKTYQNILEHNKWYKERFPNKRVAGSENCIEPPRTFFKSFLEFMLGGKMGNWLDNVLLKQTLKRWRKKYPDMSQEDFELQFRSRKNVCKRHTKGFQHRVLSTWQEKQIEFEQQFNMSLIQ